MGILAFFSPQPYGDVLRTSCVYGGQKEFRVIIRPSSIMMVGVRLPIKAPLNAHLFTQSARHGCGFHGDQEQSSMACSSNLRSAIC